MERYINIFKTIFGNQKDCIYRIHYYNNMLTIKFAKYDSDKRRELINIICGEYIPFLEHDKIITCLVRIN